jgi:hypothetical protein
MGEGRGGGSISGGNSGNIPGTFSKLHSGNVPEHSGNMQFELRWTPVSPHPNCKKHLKKAPRLTQNTTQGTCREHSVQVRGAG